MAALFSYGNILITQNEMTFENVMMSVEEIMLCSIYLIWSLLNRVVNCMLFGTQSVGQNAGM